MMTTEQWLIILLLLLTYSIGSIIRKILRQRDRELDLMKYEIDIRYGSDSRIENQLNSLIDSVFDEYRLYNLEFRDNAYIKEVDENKIVKDICEMVIQRISPVFLTQLSTYFNTDNLGSVIAVKISTKVMEYRILRNMEGEKAPNKKE